MIAIFPGSFDPFHQGHLNILQKALPLFDKLYVAVTINLDKPHQSDIEIRYENVKEQCQKISPKIEVLINRNELTSSLAKRLGATYIIRGLRNHNDLTYEMDLAFANKKLNNDLETIFFIADYNLTKISSSLMRQIDKLKNKD